MVLLPLASAGIHADLTGGGLKSVITSKTTNSNA